jgi:hypothetical protein
VSFAFSHDLDNMKKYTDDIWRKTVSSDCDQSIQVWEKQPEQTNKWSSSLYRPPRDNFYSDDIFLSGGNIFFPTSGPSTSGTRRLNSSQANRRKSSSAFKALATNACDMNSDDEGDFLESTMKKRLSLSSLRNSLCRQKAVENLNNGSAQSAVFAIDSNDDFLQVLILLFLLNFIMLNFCLYFFCSTFFVTKKNFFSLQALSNMSFDIGSMSTNPSVRSEDDNRHNKKKK